MRALHRSTRGSVEVLVALAAPVALAALCCGPPTVAALAADLESHLALDAAVAAEAHQQGCRASRWSAGEGGEHTAYVTVDLRCAGVPRSVDWTLHRGRDGRWLAR